MPDTKRSDGSADHASQIRWTHRMLMPALLMLALPVSGGPPVCGSEPTGKPSSRPQRDAAAELTLDSLRVATAQIPVTRNVATNVQALLRAIDQAAAEKADILLTPEGSLSGYTHEFDRPQVETALPQVVGKAREAHLALALGTCFVEPSDGRCYNQIRFYDADGNFLGFHSKILRCGTLTDPPVGEINHYAASPLRTFQIKGITVGGLICNDLWANPQCTPMPDPHLSQQLSNMGARIIFQAINGGRDGSEWSRNVYWPFHETNLRMRARVGKLWIVTADNCQPIELPCSAPSGVLDPTGTWIAQAPHQGEHVVTCTIKLAPWISERDSAADRLSSRKPK